MTWGNVIARIFGVLGFLLAGFSAIGVISPVEQGDLRFWGPLLIAGLTAALIGSFMLLADIHDLLLRIAKQAPSAPSRPPSTGG